MHKYKVGQMVELIDAQRFVTHRELIGIQTFITAQVGMRMGEPDYEINIISSAGPRFYALESALRPINPPATGSWTEIAALLGTDIRRLREHAE